MIKNNYHEFSYQCSKDSPDFLFGKLRIRDCREEPLILLSCQMKMKKLFKKDDGR